MLLYVYSLMHYYKLLTLLLATSLTSLNAITNVFVSGGSFSNPYYDFYTDSSGTTEFSKTLTTGETYNFFRLNSATSHPFYVSDAGYNQASTDALQLSGDGSAASGITGSQSFSLFVENDFDAQLYYYCSAHASMVSTFEVVAVPEPASYPLAIGFSALLYLASRRRR